MGATFEKFEIYALFDVKYEKIVTYSTRKSSPCGYVMSDDATV